MPRRPALELADANIPVWVQGATGVRLLGSRLHDAGGECVDVKEWARGNLVERNRCSGSDDPDGAGFSSRGDHTTVRANLSTGRNRRGRTNQMA